MHHNGALIGCACKVGLVAVFEISGGSHHIDPNGGGGSQCFVCAVDNAYREIVGAAENIVKLPGGRALWCAPGFAVDLQLQDVTNSQGAWVYLRSH